MALLAKYHTLANWTGQYHVGEPNGSMTNSSSDIPGTNVLTASGDRPLTAIYTTYNGTKQGTLNYRAERGTGFSPTAGGTYWLDFYAKFITFGSGSQLHNDFSQVRDNYTGIPNPSPSPAFSIISGNVHFVRNLWADGRSFGTTLWRDYGCGSADVGGSWHHWQLGFKWTDGTDGWFEAWRDGVNTLPRTAAVRTARDDRDGASVRFGVYRDPSFAGQSIAWRLWGLEIHNSRPGTQTGPDPGTGTDTTGPTLSVLEPTSGQVVTGNLRYTIDVSDAQSGVASVTYRLVGPSPSTTTTTVFTEAAAPWDDSDDFNPFDTSTLADGDYTFRVIAADGVGNETTVDTSISLDNFTTTEPTPNTPPTGVIVPSDRTPEVGDVVTFFLGTSDDGGDSNLTYGWDFTGALTFTDYLLKTPAPTYTFTVPGTYVVRCRITDSGGLQSVASATVTVSEPATTPDPTDGVPDPTNPPPTTPGTPGFITRGNLGIAGAPPGASATTETVYPATNLYPSTTLYPGTLITSGQRRRSS